MIINPNGIIQNNTGATEFLKFLKSSEKQYKLLTKEEERKLIDEFVEIAKDENGNDILDTSDPLYRIYEQETHKRLKKNLYYRCRRVLKWKKSEEEFCSLMAMHNIRFVFSLSKKYCKGTKDYDNMIERGLYGLVKAANKFYPFSPVTKPDPLGRFSEYVGENGKTCREPNRIVQFDKNKNPLRIKFCTYAKNWIFKYLVEEFQDKKFTKISNHSISMDEIVKIKNNTDSKQTVENYIDTMIAPEYVLPKTIDEQLSSVDTENFYRGIQNYLNTTNELTAFEKTVVIDTYYHGMKVKEIAEKTNMDAQMVIQSKTKALKKLKKFMINEYKIKTVNDIV